MGPLRVRVQNGRLVLNEPCDLPEGTELELVAADPIEDMDPEERAALEAAIDKSLEEAERGLFVPIEEVLKELRELP